MCITRKWDLGLEMQLKPSRDKDTTNSILTAVPDSCPDLLIFLDGNNFTHELHGPTLHMRKRGMLMAPFLCFLPLMDIN